MTLAFPISPGNTVVTGPINNHQLEPNADGSLPIQGSFSAAPPTDTFGNATNITAAITFSGVPTISQLVANSSVLLANPGAQATFIAEINVASAFVGTLSFYGLEPDGATLQLIGTHLRGVGTTAMSTAISTAVALNQTWMGSAANFKTIYVVCTAFTSGSVSVQLGLSAAPYAVAVLNTINALITNATALGLQLTVASTSIVPASDSPSFPVKRAGVALFSTAQNAVGSGNSGDLNVAGDTEVSIDIKVTANAGTNPTIQFIYSRKGSDGIYYPVWQSSVLTPAMLSAQNNIISVSIGSGMSYNVSLGLNGQLSWLVGGTTTPTFTFTPNVAGK